MSNSIDLRQIVWMDIIEEAHKTQSQWFYLLSSSVGISRKKLGVDVEIFEILHRDWNLIKPIFVNWV